MTKTPMTQVEKMLDHIRKRGSITKREAYIDYGIESFFRRLTDIEERGYVLKRTIKRHPTTGKEYTSVSFAD